MSLELFLQLPASKQQTIVDAALAEFIEFGYELASTNRIVERAGISKGVLFKYFTSKEALFLYVCQRAGETVVQAMELPPGGLPDDYFAALRRVALRELELRQAHPDLFALFDQVLADPSRPVHRKALATYAQQAQQLMAHLAKRFPAHRLRPGITVAQALTYIHWTVTGMKRDVDLRTLSTEHQLTQLDQLFDFFKYGLFATGSDKDHADH